ncbi:MAG: hypothetical protein AAFQ67_07455 [Pseudomonadota bacterium]
MNWVLGIELICVFGLVIGWGIWEIHKTERDLKNDKRDDDSADDGKA